MCFDLDSQPPIAPIAGGSLDQGSLVITGEDGNRVRAFRARPAEPTGAGILILPDVRGLHHYYEELVLRFAEAGVEALAIDYFGRTTALDSPRDASFEYHPHVDQTTWDGLTADIRAGAEELRAGSDGRVRSLFVVGFCFGGRLAFDSATLGLGQTGVIGFYGRPRGEHRGNPAPVDVATSMQGDVLGLFGGADEGIPPDAVTAFEDALTAAGVPHRLVTYDGAPHSFFDRKAAEFADASAAAWAEVLEFVRSRTA